MKVIKIKFEYRCFPVWIYGENNELIGYNTIYHDYQGRRFAIALNRENPDMVYTDKQLALKYINLAIEEVNGDNESYFLYKRRSKIKEALGDHLGAREDILQYERMKAKVDIKRVHALKHQAEQEDTAFAYYYLAYAYEQIKDYDNAIWAINKAIERTDLNNQYKRYRTELVKHQESL